MTTWTEKHDAFCLAHKLEGAAKLIWQWMIHHPNQQKEPDLGQFNKWAAKHRGKPYHRDTIKIAWAKLVDTGVVRPLKRYTWKIWGIILRSVTLLVNPPQPRKRSRPSNCDRDQEPSNEQYADDRDVTTTTSLSLNRGEHFPSDAELLQAAPLTEASYLEQNIQRCEEAGIEFTDSKEAVKVLAHTHPEDVMAACDYYLEYIKRNKVGKPAGFLRRCLERRWWEKGQKVSFFDALLSLCVEMGRIKA
jgi:hypothetical protein